MDVSLSVYEIETIMVRVHVHVGQTTGIWYQLSTNHTYLLTCLTHKHLSTLTELHVT